MHLLLQKWYEQSRYLVVRWRFQRPQYFWQMSGTDVSIGREGRAYRLSRDCSNSEENECFDRDHDVDARADVTLLIAADRRCQSR